MTPHKCPACDGTGLRIRPPWVAGDQVSWVSSGTGPYPCAPCNGTGLLWAWDGTWEAHVPPDQL